MYPTAIFKLSTDLTNYQNAFTNLTWLKRNTNGKFSMRSIQDKTPSGYLKNIYRS